MTAEGAVYISDGIGSVLSLSAMAQFVVSVWSVSRAQVCSS